MIAEALVCLALNIYHEAKNQPLIGQIAVAQVTINRVRDVGTVMARVINLSKSLHGNRQSQ